MNKSMNEAIFDTYLEMAFEENMRKEAEEAPSKEELDKLFPIQKKYRKKLLRAIKENKYKKPLCLVYLRRAAIIALVCFSALAGGMLTSQDVRAVLKATILEWFDKYITLDFTESVDNINFPTDVNEVHYEYIPEGYSLRYKIDDPECKMYIYSNSDGMDLIIDIFNPAFSSQSVDNEHHEYEDIVINNRHVHFFYDEREHSGIAVVGNNDCVSSVQGYLSKDELIKIVENIK